MSKERENRLESDLERFLISLIPDFKKIKEYWRPSTKIELINVQNILVHISEKVLLIINYLINKKKLCQRGFEPNSMANMVYQLQHRLNVEHVDNILSEIIYSSDLDATDTIEEQKKPFLEYFVWNEMWIKVIKIW